MRILLLGEFSGFHSTLKKGLEANGHNVTLFSNGDGWKKLNGADSRLIKYSKANTILKKIANAIYPFRLIMKLKNYDVVHLVNPFIFSNSRISKFLIWFIRKQNRVISLSACGLDPIYIKTMGELPYSPLDSNERKCYYTAKEIQRFEYILEQTDMIIPVMYDYYLGYQNHRKYAGTIPLPINLSESKKKTSPFSDKIIIYHGISRHKFKGSEHIIQALKRIDRNFSHIVEIIITEKVPFIQYQKLLNKCDILIDQCKSQSYGMNALLGLAAGKIVLSGAEPQAIKHFGSTYKCPIFNIIPDENQIYLQLETIIVELTQKKLKIEMNNNYLEDLHCHIKVAKEYEKVWKEKI